MATSADAGKKGSKSAKHRVRNQGDNCVLRKQDGVHKLSHRAVDCLTASLQRDGRTLREHLVSLSLTAC
jgi:hypothetical protein